MKQLIILIIFLGVNCAHAQSEKNNEIKSESNELKFGKNRLGLTYSALTGDGITYLRAFENGLSLKTQLYFLGNTNNDDQTFLFNNKYTFEIGAELQYNLAYHNNNRLYVLAGFYYEYYQLKNKKLSPSFSTQSNFERTNNFGFGFGFEVMILDNISFSLDAGSFQRFEFDSRKADKEPTIINKPINLSFGMGISLLYTF